MKFSMMTRLQKFISCSLEQEVFLPWQLQEAISSLTKPPQRGVSLWVHFEGATHCMTQGTSLPLQCLTVGVEI